MKYTTFFAALMPVRAWFTWMRPYWLVNTMSMDPHFLVVATQVVQKRLLTILHTLQCLSFIRVAD